VSVLANRGAAGIDGTVSTAVGAALAWRSGGGGPAVALVGDLTFLHDANGIVLGPAEARPDLTLVVVDNDGGAIFSLLEQGGDEPAPAFERVFGTPHGVDIAALASAVGVPVLAPTSADDLAAVMAEKDAGLRLIHLRTDRARVRDLSRRLREAVAAAVG
jgi:2-succinyl-5-enolpyruvyl-6-hydroxy-3-cyclohexene-1-carboxylate synthase